MNERIPSIVTTTFHLLFFIALIFSVIIAKSFFAPLALAILFAYLLFPIANFFETRLRIPRILSILLTIILAIVLLGAGFFVIYKQLEILVSDFPTLKRKALHNIDAIASFIEMKFGVSQDSQKTWAKESISRAFDNGNIHLAEIFGSTTGSIGRIVILPVFIFFMLYYRDKAYEFILKVTKEEKKALIVKILEQISHVTKHYMGGVVVVVMILCVLNSIGLYIVGLDYAIMLGIIAAVCNFIPYFGTILGFSFPLVFALLTADSPRYTIGVIILFFIVQFTENNILTPNIVGGNVKLNPFIIILSLIVGAMVWGIAGMLVVVPLMAVIRIICENVDNLKPYAFLLGVEGTEKHSVTFGKIKGLFYKITKRRAK